MHDVNDNLKQPLKKSEYLLQGASEMGTSQEEPAVAVLLS